MLGSYFNCQDIPQSTCSLFAVLLITSLHFILRIQLGKYPVLLKKTNMYLSQTPPAPLTSSVSILAFAIECVDGACPNPYAAAHACLTLDTKTAPTATPSAEQTLTLPLPRVRWLHAVANPQLRAIALAISAGQLLSGSHQFRLQCKWVKTTLPAQLSKPLLGVSSLQVLRIRRGCLLLVLLQTGCGDFQTYHRLGTRSSQSKVTFCLK